MVWAAEIADFVREYDGENRRIAIDSAQAPMLPALEAEGLELVDGNVMLEHAKAIKSLEEIRGFKQSQSSCDATVAALRGHVQPGMRESDALAFLVSESIARGAESTETRLLTSGPRTCPWFQETSQRVIGPGDMFMLDTDLIGPMGFYNDISRSWVVGDEQPSTAQRRLYEAARTQLDANVGLLRAGTSISEFCNRAFELAPEHQPNRYANIGHGCGLGMEYPYLWHPEDAVFGAYDDILQENMIICIESYAGTADGEGVKLEQPVLITKRGPLLLADCPLEDAYA